MTALKTLVFLLLVPGTVLFYVPYLILSTAPGSPTIPTGVFRYAAVVPWVAGIGILTWCARDFTVRGRGTPAPIDPPKELVVQGLYRFVRNPMYVGAMLVLAGHVVWTGSLWLLLYAGLLFLFFHLFVVFYEEPTLRSRFGESYVRYAKDVSRWIPRFRNATSSPPPSSAAR